MVKEKYFKLCWNLCESRFKKIIKAKKENLSQKNIGDIVGLDIKPEFPKRPDIVIYNNFDKEIRILANILIKIEKIILKMKF